VTLLSHCVTNVLRYSPRPPIPRPFLCLGACTSPAHERQWPHPPPQASPFLPPWPWSAQQSILLLAVPGPQCSAATFRSREGK